MDQLIKDVTSHWHIIVCSVILTLLVMGFILDFVLTGIKLKYFLKKANKKLLAFKKKTTGNITNLEEIEEILSFSIEQWYRYKLHLYTIIEATPAKQEENTASTIWKSNVPAAAFFSKYNLVDKTLRVDYYRHLPGLLTGIGIIGTFFGLINGLSGFDITDPNKVFSNLKSLMSAVSESFIVSAAAISFAIMFTWVEKSMVSRCNGLADTLAINMDNLFYENIDNQSSKPLAEIVSCVKELNNSISKFNLEFFANIQTILNEIKEDNLKSHITENRKILNDVNLVINDLKSPLVEIATTLEESNKNRSSELKQVVSTLIEKQIFAQSRLADDIAEKIAGIITENFSASQD